MLFRSLGPKQLYRLGESLAESVIARHARRLGGRARRVTIDLDPTDDPTHGAQQLSFFNSHYDNACYLPMMGFVTFNDEPDPYRQPAGRTKGSGHPLGGRKLPQNEDPGARIPR